MLRDVTEGLVNEAQSALLILGMFVLAIALHKGTKAVAGLYLGLTIERFRISLLDGNCTFVNNGQYAAVRQCPEMCLALYGAAFLTNFGLLATMVVVMTVKGHDAADYFCFVFAGTNLLVLLLALKPGSSFNEDFGQLQSAWRAAHLH